MICRASTTCKDAAFGAPPWMRDPDMCIDPTNPLSPLEIQLQKHYIDLGRPDLAACVLNARSHQRMDDLIGYRVLLFDSEEHWHWFMTRLRCILQTMDGCSEEDCPRSPIEYQEQLRQRYAQDPSLECVVELDKKLKEIRRPVYKASQSIRSAL